jgi:hypothetical protein
MDQTPPAVAPADIQTLFTDPGGDFRLARWGRPIAPVVFGVDDATLAVIKGAFRAVTGLAGHPMADTDPELGGNFLLFFFRDWAELPEVPGMDRLLPDLGETVARLSRTGANQYRVFRFDDDGAIKAVFVFLRMDAVLSEMPAETLALSQVVQAMLTWSGSAFRDRSPLALAADRVILRPEIAGVIRAAYDPVLPVSARDPGVALRLCARMTVREVGDDRQTPLGQGL